ncbi:MAG TPA: glycosyltransferase [Burkholderiaceae bacterium]|jgi:UDP-N-acetylmuramyl pentapeptide phosphotransferase/UDP-N-acetylglucosamine-1-phosphate transferase|nr:glycosyltransferase [Burkholderiaceae bacterium]
MIWILLVAFACSAVAMFIVVASAHRHAHWSADDDLSGPQKMHVKAVPRVGGLGVAAGVCGGAALLMWQAGELRAETLALLACMSPAFGSGIWEDFTKAISPRRRMLALALSGLLGVLLAGGKFTHSGWAFLDHLLAAGGLLWIGSVGAVFAVTGISNSVNIIDGMNGLASMCVTMTCAALAFIGWQVGDVLVCGIALATVGATLGFFVWNYPRGLVFLGDGGAYLLGFIAAELGILLTTRHPEVSMLSPLLLVAYPVFETLFTMYRRRFIHQRPMTQPDASHLHTLIYRRLKRGTEGSTRANSGTSPYLWLLNAVAVVPATIWWHNTPVLALSLAAFVLVYLDLYWRIVRFRSPRWMTSNRELPASPEPEPLEEA